MLSKEFRLNRNSFKEVLDKGFFLHTPYILYRYLKDTKDKQFAVSVSKKVSKSAVSRNKFRRRVFSIVKDLEKKMSKNSNVWVVLILKPEITSIDFSGLKEKINDSFVKLGFLK